MPRTGGGAFINNSSQVATGALLPDDMVFSAFNTSIIPDSPSIRNLGAGAFRWGNIFSGQSTIEFHNISVLPLSNNTISVGRAGNVFTALWANDIQGDARSLIFAAAVAL